MARICTDEIFGNDSVEFCKLMPVITTKSERIDHGTKMHRSLVRFCGLEMLNHTQSSADFITITCGFRFSVQTSFDFLGTRCEEGTGASFFNRSLGRRFNLPHRDLARSIEVCSACPPTP